MADSGRRWGHGLLRVPDPERAAERFAFLVFGAPLDAALFDAEGRPTSDEVIKERALAGVEVSLRTGVSDRRPA